MSLHKFSFMGALVVMGLLIHSNGHGAEILGRTAEDLPWLMKNEGIRLPIQLEQRTDLQPMMTEATTQALKIDPSCATQTLSEVHLKEGGSEFIAGYEVYTLCEDTPTPAMGLYFDVNHRYLGALDLSN